MDKSATPFPRFSVKVTGRWTDETTGTETEHEETYRVLALREDQAQMAGKQMFGADAAKQHCRMSGDAVAECAEAS